MSSEKLSHPPGDAVQSPGDSLDDRVLRLEQLIDSFDSVRIPAAASGGPAGNAGLAAIEHLSIVAARLRALVEEIERRVQAIEWDGVDVLTARLLLEDLTGALRDCRLIASESEARLDVAQATIKEARRRLDRQTARASEPNAVPTVSRVFSQL